MIITSQTALDARIQAVEALIAAWTGRALVWGEADCAMLAASAVRLVTGREALDGVPAYHDAATAREAIRAAGFRSLAGLVSARSGGGPLRAPLMAAPGDILLYRSDVPRLPALGVATVDGRALGFVATASGLVCIHGSAMPAIRAWRVI
jgi:hypothetical protein